MQYPSSKQIAAVLAELHARMKFGENSPKVVLLSHEEFRILAGRAALRTSVLRSVSSHLDGHKLHLFGSKDFYLLVPWGEPSKWKGPTAALLRRLAAPVG